MAAVVIGEGAVLVTEQVPHLPLAQRPIYGEAIAPNAWAREHEVAVGESLLGALRERLPAKLAPNLRGLPNRVKYDVE
jgi:hypothetical protein